MATEVELKIDGSIATFTFVSEKANVLSAATLEVLSRQVAAAEANKQVRVGIFTGGGPTFLAGADIKELAGLLTPSSGLRVGRLGKAVLNAIAGSPMVSIAAINGVCVGGGCELALACDLRIATVSAKIGLPEVGLGVIPGWGGTQRLPRLIGSARAKELILTGQVITGEAAASVGLVNQVVPDGDVMAAALVMANRILGPGPAAVRAAKTAIDRGLNRDLAGGLEVENELFSQCFGRAEAMEGLNAFLQKRPAKWPQEA
ncbi:MAG: enoyl-CoA hydratase-related protein [Phycisphaerae bacterium]|nr:enoyl-CoA hydratase-related protein [Phycisphaerae bacterium]